MASQSKLRIGTILWATIVLVGMPLMLTSAPKAYGQPFVEIGGQLLFEAEDFNSRRPNGADNWLLVPEEHPGFDYENASGGCNADGVRRYLTSTADVNDRNTDVFDQGPTVSYDVRIVTGGDYAIWFRRAGFDGGSDSVFVRVRGRGMQPFPPIHFGEQDRDLADSWQLAITETLEPGLYTIDFAARETRSAFDTVLLDRTGTFDGTDAAAAAIPCSARCEGVAAVSHLPADTVNLASVDVPTRIGVTVGLPQPRDATVTVTSTNLAVAAGAELTLTAGGGTCAGTIIDILDVDSGSTTLNLTNSAGLANGPGRQINVIALQSIGLQLPFAAMEPGGTQSARVVGNFGAAGFRTLTASSTFASSNPAVAGVGPDGVVTALTLGQTDITAANGNETSTLTITVAERVTKIALVVGSQPNDLNEADAAIVAHLRTLRFSGDPGQLDDNGLQPQVRVFDDDDYNPGQVDAELDLLISSPTISVDKIGANFQCRSIPHVFSNPALNGLASEGLITMNGTTAEPVPDIFILDTMHPITQGLTVDADGFLVINDTPQTLGFGSGEAASEVVVLADTGTEGEQFLAVAEAGTLRLGGESTFLGRRVFMGLGADGFDDLNADGRTLFSRSVDWALASARLMCDAEAPTPFVEVAGFLRFEAEDYDDLLPDANGETWLIVPDEDNGDGYFNERGACNDDGQPRYLTPGDDVSDRSGPVFTLGPSVTYVFQILTPGTYDLWMRWAGFSGGSDSVFMRIREIGEQSTETPKNNDRFDLTDAWKVAVTETLDAGIYHLDIVARENNSGVDEIILDGTDTFDGTDLAADGILCSPRCVPVDAVSHLPTDDINLASVDVPTRVGVAFGTPARADGTVTVASSNPAVAGDVMVPVSGSAASTCFGAGIDVIGPGSTMLTLGNDLGFDNSPQGRQINVITPQVVDLQVPTTVLEPGDTIAATVIGGFGAAGERDLTSSATGTTYASNDEGVVTVGPDGSITATGLGTAEVTATNDVTSTVALVVAEQVTKIAFLVGETDLNSGDQAVVDFLNGLSFTGDPGQTTAAGGLPPQVLLFDDDDFDAEAINARFDLLITSSTVSSGNVAGAFRCLNLPHVFWEGALNRPDREGLTDDSEGTPANDPATGDPIVDLFILDNTHPITLDLPADPDTVVVYDSGQAMSGAKGALAPGATVLADTGFVDVGGAAIWAIVAAEAGTVRVDGASVFLGRRASLFFGDESFAGASATGQDILRRSVDWALAGTREDTQAAAIQFAATSFVTVGGTTQLQVEVGSADGECTEDATSSPLTTYVSSNDSIATADANGAVTGVSVGDVTIIVSNGPFSGSAVLSVVDPEAPLEFDFDTAGQAFDFDFLGEAIDTWSIEANPLNGDSLALRSDSNGGLGSDPFSRVAMVKAALFNAVNVEASVDMTWDNDDDRSGIYVRFVDPDNFYYLHVEGDNNLDDQVRLYRSRNGTVERLVNEVYSAVVDIDGTLGETHTITFRAEGDRLFARIDGIPLPGLDPFVDPDPLLVAGRVGVGQNSNPTYFDNFSLTNLGGLPPALVQIADGLGATADTFISSLGDGCGFTQFNLEATEPLTLDGVTSTYTAGGPAPDVTLVDNGGGQHVVTLSAPLTPGHWLRLDLNVTGATSGQSTVLTVFVAHQPLDITQDGQTNIQDATAFGTVFGGSREPRLIDINCDGAVNVQDATAFGANWNGVNGTQWRNTGLPAKP